MLLALAVVFALVAGVRAEEGKDVTLKGSITCAKCDLKKEAKCTTVIAVKEGEKTTVYYFDDASGKKYHKEICTEAKPGMIKGTCKKVGDKLVVTVTELKFD
jgi:RecG-like helicase